MARVRVEIDDSDELPIPFTTFSTWAPVCLLIMRAYEIAFALKLEALVSLRNRLLHCVEIP